MSRKRRGLCQRKACREFRTETMSRNILREQQHDRRMQSLRLLHDQELTQLVSAPTYDSFRRAVAYGPLHRPPSLDLDTHSLGRGCGPTHLCIWGPVPAGLRPAGRKGKKP